MVIGDAVAAFLGTGTVDRQPAVGVEEQISSIVKPGATDAIAVFDGTNSLNVITGSVVTSDDPTNASQRYGGDHNIAIMITNSIYIRKEGTTDRVYVGGVQTNV